MSDVSTATYIFRTLIINAFDVPYQELEMKNRKNIRALVIWVYSGKKMILHPITREIRLYRAKEVSLAIYVGSQRNSTEKITISYTTCIY